jgi:hypothetical protein
VQGKNSYFSISWNKNLSTGSWIFSQRLTTSSKYPWLMLYLRADATEGFNGGYHYSSRGIIRKVSSLALLLARNINLMSEHILHMNAH